MPARVWRVSPHCQPPATQSGTLQRIDLNAIDLDLFRQAVERACQRQRRARSS